MEARYQTFTGLILNISRCIQKIKNCEVSELGLKGKQVQCLFFLHKLEEGVSLTELCDLCDEDKGAMSRSVKELMEKNLVYVDEKSTQKYRNPIKLTAQGQKDAAIIYHKINNMISMGGNGISDTDREVFYKALTKISDNLTAICENYGGKND